MQPNSKPRLDPSAPVRYPRRMSGKSKSDEQDEKAARLAEALRANLKRRKSQSRARRAAENAKDTSDEGANATIKRTSRPDD